MRGKIRWRRVLCPVCGDRITNNALGRDAHIRHCTGATPKGLSPEELAAMQEWRRVYGRSWRAALVSAWERHRYDGMDDRHIVPLASLRTANGRGPRWLAKFQLPTVEVRR
jgi:hypothetical protein